MSKRWPISKKSLEIWKENKINFNIGEAQLVPLNSNIYVYQILVQKGLRSKNNEAILDYAALTKCLRALAVIAKDMNATVHMPKIGAGQAKGDWNVIQGIIHEELIKKDIRVNVYVLKGISIDDKYKTPLTLFDTNKADE